MLQRVAAIDSLFSDFERLYLQISFQRYRRLHVQSRGRVKVVSANFFLHRRFVARCLRDAEKIYVHTCLNAIKVFPWIQELRSKIVIDLHGLVPEQFALSGNNVLARVFGPIERWTIRNSSLLIAVTDRMAEHFVRKYPNEADPRRILTLPIFESEASARNAIPLAGPRKSGMPLRLVYAGGAQSWQNVGLMLQTLRRLTNGRNDVHMSIYAPPDGVRGIERQVSSLGLGKITEVGSLSHEDLLEKYAEVDAGFVLRDDVPVNQVSMPTKLVEYMTYGVAPIVLSPYIGDFPRHGYRYLLLDELFDPDKLAPSSLEEIRGANFRAVASIRAVTLEARAALRAIIAGGSLKARPIVQP
jgi:hypothetical protein